MQPPSRNPQRIVVQAAFYLVAFSALTAASFARPPQSKAQDERYVVEYFYKAKWGYADEFIRLYRKNHYPVLKKQIETGRIISVTVVRPRYHATEDGRWDYCVTIVWKNVAASINPSGEEAIIKQLFPDQETFRREEQHRFEILFAHWDVPVARVDLEQ